MTAGYGTYNANNDNFYSSNYATTAWNPDGTTSVTYDIAGSALTVNLAKFAGPVSAQWYDPSNGTYQSVTGSPFANTSSRVFQPPGKNQEGYNDWVLVLRASAVADTPPNVTALSQTLSKGQTLVAASSLFTASDPDGDTITKYAFWNTGSGGGHFVLNGVTQGTNQEIDVTAAQLAQFNYQAGSGADTLWVAAYDGTQWSGTPSNKWSPAFTVSGPIDTPPNVTALSQTLSKGQTLVAASSLFTASDPDGDTITKYAFWNTGSGGGHFVLNGVTQGTNQEIDVTAAQLAQFNYQAGSGADTLWVAAYDGTQWSGTPSNKWSPAFTVSGPIDTPPNVTALSQTLSKGQTLVAASSLFTASDPDGDTITKYAFWNTGSGGGHFVLNGVTQGTNQEIDVTAAQLAQFNYQAGSGADTLWVAAYDGTQWSGTPSNKWSPAFTVSGPIDTPPNVTALSQTLSKGQTLVAASSLFTASDPDGDTITKYAFWNTGSGGGHFVLNGVTQGTNQEIDVTAAQLAQFNYQAGSGADTLWVAAYDGTQWSGTPSNNWSPAFTVSGPIDTPPNVTALSQTLSKGQTLVAASSLFTASDPDGDTITKYQFWDSTTDPASGHWVVNGTVQGTNQAIDVTAAQLAQTAFQSGSGSDDLWVRASDGFNWSAWEEFHVNAPLNHAPVVTAPNFTASHNQTIAASSLFTVTDSDGDSPSNYQFWDSTSDPASGHFTVNGVVQTAGHAIDVTATQLAQTSFQSGSGSDDLWVRANDGMLWSAWEEFHVNAPIDAKPVVTSVTNNIKTMAGQTFAVSSLFSASDPDGDAIAQYDFWDTGAGGGRFVLNGQALGANQDNYVSAAQLGQTTYVAGTDTDTLWVRVSDGTLWSAWSKSFTISDPPTIGAGEILELPSAYSGTIAFAGATGTLKLDDSGKLCRDCGGNGGRGRD